MKIGHLQLLLEVIRNDMEDCTVINFPRLVSEPKGDDQKECLPGYYSAKFVDQKAGSFAEDEYYGNIYYKIAKDVWIEVGYSI